MVYDSIPTHTPCAYCSEIAFVRADSSSYRYLSGAWVKIEAADGNGADGNGVYSGGTSQAVPDTTDAITSGGAGIEWRSDDLKLYGDIFLTDNTFVQGILDLGANRIQNVADPILTGDAVNYQTLQGEISDSLTNYVAYDDSLTTFITPPQLADTLNTVKLDSITLSQDSILLGWIRGVEVSRDTIAGTDNGGSADGVTTAGTHDTGNEELDFTVASPGSNFSVDVSALTSDSELADSTAAIRGDFPVPEVTSAILADTAFALRTDLVA